MKATRFDGASAVARYWLAQCEGFTVTGEAQGVVAELIRGDDPYLTASLVVRRRGRRRKIVPVEAVAAVDPHERLIVVARRPRGRRHHRSLTLPPFRAYADRSAGRVAMVARAAAVYAVVLGRSIARLATRFGGGVAAGVVLAAHAARPAAVALPRAFLRLAAEAQATGISLIRSIPWRRFAPSARSATTKRWRGRWRSSLLRRMTSSPTKTAPRTSSAARTTSST